MGWKVRSDKLKLVNTRVKDRGGRQQVRWQAAQYKIQETLAQRGQTLEDGLDITDLQYLTQKRLLIGDAANLLIEVMPELKCQRFTLAAIQNHFIPYYSLSIDTFLNDYLKIKDNSHGTWTKFFKGETAIEDEAFRTICHVLDLDYRTIGTNSREIPDWKKLEVLLWQLNHTTQTQYFQDLARQSHNLVCLKFVRFPETQIPIFWLLKNLLQPVEKGFQKVAIDFESPILSGTDDRLDSIIAQLRLPENSTSKQPNPKLIARKIHRKMLKENKTIVLFFLTHDRQSLTELDELVHLLYQPLQQEFSQRQPQQKLLMVWIDSPASMQGEADNLDGEADNYPAYSKIPFCSKFDLHDIVNWTNLEEVNLLFDRTRNNLSNCPTADNNLADLIWSESQEGRSERLLESVYNLCNLKWEAYQGSWQKI